MTVVPATGPWIEASPIGDLLIRSAARHGDKIALFLPEQRRTFTELLNASTDIARGLIARGVRRGEHVGLLTSNGVEMVEALFAIALMGAVAVPINTRHKPREIQHIVKDADLVAVLTVSDEAAYVDFVQLLHDSLDGMADLVEGDAALRLPQAPLLRQAILLRGRARPGCVDAQAFAVSARTVEASHVRDLGQLVRLRDTAIIVYTSGTTSNPKGCMLSHEAITRGSVERATHRFACGDHDVHWCPGPLFHLGALAPAIGAWGAGAAVATDVYFDPSRALTLIRDSRATVLFPWFPAIVLDLMKLSGFSPDDLPDVKRLGMIGPSAMVRQVMDRFPGVDLFQTSGMTETAGVFGLNWPSDSAEERANTQGKVHPGVEFRLIDPDTGCECDPGEIGEILVRGPCVMEGYYNDPDKTAQSLDVDGWLHTSDLYEKTPDDNLIFKGRMKDMLKVGGENVAAIEIESYLCQHPAVRIAEVVGRPDARLDEVPVAFVEVHDDVEVSEQALIDFCTGRIAKYKVPREVYFVTPGAWPMSLTKVDKRALRERLSMNDAAA